MASRSLGVGVVALLLGASLPSHAYDASASADNDRLCIADRMSDSLTCTAAEFTVSPALSAETGTAPFCLAGSTTQLKVEVTLSDSNADRYDIAFWVGQQGNDPGTDTVANNLACSVATFPTSGTLPATWMNADGDACGDFTAAGVSTTLVDEIKVVCQPGPTGFLSVPYLLTYKPPGGGATGNTTCNSTADLVVANKSKCNKGIAEVSGATAVGVGGWMDVTKQTLPDGDPQTFSYTATVSSGKVMVLTGATLTGNTYSGGAFTPATLSAATNTANFTLQDGQTARVFVNAEAAAKTLTVTETAATGWDPDALAISCSNQQGTPITDLDGDVASRSMTANISTTNYAGSCTITNRKRPAVTITKISNGDVGTFNFTGNNTWASQNITTITSGVGVAGATQYLPVGVATTITETAAAGYRMENISCTTSAGAATTDTSTRTASFNAAAMGAGETINCTFTNRRQRTLQTAKVLSPLSDSGLFVMNANGTLSAEGGNGTIAARIVDVGATVTASESAGTGTDLANYTSTYACENAATNALLFNGSGSSVSFTMPNVDVACFITNSRKSASLVLRKTWQDAIVSNAVDVTASGLTTFASAANTASETDTAAGQTVYAGNAYTLGETFTSGSAGNYNASLGCSGNTTALSGNVLTIDPADTAITCTYTNTRKTASLVLAKTWENAITTNAINFTATGLTTFSSTANTANETDTAAAQTVRAGDSITLAESFTSGNSGDYNSALACTGNNTALVGNVLNIVAADEGNTITCTYGNSRPGPNLTVSKTVSVVDDPVSVANDKAIPGATLRYTITLQNSSAVYSSDAVNLVDNFDDDNLQYVPGSASASNGAAISVTDTGGPADEDRVQVNTSVPAGGTVTVTFDVQVK